MLGSRSKQLLYFHSPTDTYYHYPAETYFCHEILTSTIRHWPPTFSRYLQPLSDADFHHLADIIVFRYILTPKDADFSICSG